MTPEDERKVINLINEEARRMVFGRIFIEVNVMNGVPTNVQAETRRSINISNRGSDR